MQPTKNPREVHNFSKLTISEHLELISQSLSANYAKPKHHFLTHYVWIMMLMCSLSNISSMRFKAKHFQGKVAGKLSRNCVNICWTIALKEHFYKIAGYANAWKQFSHRNKSYTSSNTKAILVTEWPSITESKNAIIARNILRGVDMSWTMVLSNTIPLLSEIAVRTIHGPHSDDVHEDIEHSLVRKALHAVKKTKSSPMSRNLGHKNYSMQHLSSHDSEDVE